MQLPVYLIVIIDCNLAILMRFNRGYRYIAVCVTLDFH